MSNQKCQAESIKNVSDLFTDKNEPAEIMRILEFIRLTDLVRTLNKIYPPNSQVSLLDKISAMAESKDGKLNSKLLTTVCQYSKENNQDEKKKDENNTEENPRIMYHLTRSQSQCICNTLVNQKKYQFKNQRGTKERINEALENNFCRLDFNSDYTCYYGDDGYGFYTTQNERDKLDLPYFVPQQKNLAELKDLVNEIQKEIHKIDKDSKESDNSTMDDLKTLKYQLENCCTNETSHVALQKFLEYLNEKIQNGEKPLLILKTLAQIAQTLEKTLTNRSLSNGSMFSSSSSSSSSSSTSIIITISESSTSSPVTS